MNVRRPRGMICVGDLVLPVEASEFLFSSPEAAVEESDPIDTVWEVDSPGVVLRVLSFSPAREYCHVRILVGDVVGWTFSDYIRVISSGP